MDEVKKGKEKGESTKQGHGAGKGRSVVNFEAD